MSNTNKKAFSLIELLIVIGIISLLVAIIMPALGRARDQAKLVICKSNQRGLLLGCLIYASDNNSRLPMDDKLHNSHTILIDSLSKGSYVDCQEIYYCPSETSEDIRYSKENFNEGNIGYFYYCFNTRPTYRYLSSFFLKKTPWPRVLKDTDKQNRWVFSDSWFSGVPTAHRWHKKGVNYVTLDGVVHMVKESPKNEFK